MKNVARLWLVSAISLSLLASHAAYAGKAKTKTSKSKSTSSSSGNCEAPEGYGPFNCGENEIFQSCGKGGANECGKPAKGFYSFCDTSVPKPPGNKFAHAGTCKTAQLSAKGKKATPAGLKRDDFVVKKAEGKKKGQTSECYDLSQDRVSVTSNISIAYDAVTTVDSCNANSGRQSNLDCNIINAAVTPTLDGICGTKGQVPSGFTVFSRAYNYKANPKDQNVTVTAICSICDSKTITPLVRKQNAFFKKVDAIRVTGCGGAGCH